MQMRRAEILVTRRPPSSNLGLLRDLAKRAAAYKSRGSTRRSQDVHFVVTSRVVWCQICCFNAGELQQRGRPITSDRDYRPSRFLQTAGMWSEIAHDATGEGCIECTMHDQAISGRCVVVSVTGRTCGHGGGVGGHVTDVSTSSTVRELSLRLITGSYSFIILSNCLISPIQTIWYKEKGIHQVNGFTMADWLSRRPPRLSWSLGKDSTLHSRPGLPCIDKLSLL
jgi:hypothetical protein